ncbi:hypothetical protein DZA28_29960 [Pseudomonas alloputida]|uniref:Uncharacterized protein n=1 Tax=Pseudomonas alloputida TaxID=1940621 RepID=A0ABY3CXG4_9PSED|nr:hypothetical protein DZA28_29960 [Pseudomonas alloputida]
MLQHRACQIASDSFVPLKSILGQHVSIEIELAEGSPCYTPMLDSMASSPATPTAPRKPSPTTSTVRCSATPTARASGFATSTTRPCA